MVSASSIPHACHKNLERMYVSVIGFALIINQFVVAMNAFPQSLIRV